MPKDLIKRIHKYNAPRDPEVVKLKYAAIAESPFRFFRGTCHLYYEDMPKKSFILKSPDTWQCGDLHLENFGSFKGDNRLAYFDMNDFDESFLGPCLLDVVRLCTSVFLAADMVKLEIADCHEPVRKFLGAYANTLANGYIRFVQAGTSDDSIIEALLEKVAKRQRKELLDKKLIFGAKGPSIKINGLKAIAADKKTKKIVKQTVEQWAKKNTKHPDFFRVLDVANRGIGTGSIGIERHIVSVQGHGAPDGYHVLDVKECLAASALRYLKLKQPKWNNEAERLVLTQKRVQACTPAFMNTINIKGKWFLLKELQPFEDKLAFETLDINEDKLGKMLIQMGEIVAWNNLRSTGRQGSAIADTMIKFGEKLYKQEDQIIAYASDYAETITGYWKEYVKAYKPEKKKK